MRAVACMVLAIGTSACGLVEDFPELAASDAGGADDAADSTVDVATDDTSVDAMGPIAYYRGSGVDLSGHGIDAVWHGPTLVADRFGNPTLAASFDGTTYLEVATHPLLPLGHAPRTVSVWMRTTHDYTKTAAGGLVNYGRAATGQRCGLLIAQNHQGYFVGESADLTGGPAIDDGRWHNVVVTFDGKLVALYVDVALAASANIALDTVGLALEIGRSALGHFPEPFFGELDEIQIWDRALTSAERRAIYYANGWQ